MRETLGQQQTDANRPRFCDLAGSQGVSRPGPGLGRRRLNHLQEAVVQLRVHRAQEGCSRSPAMPRVGDLPRLAHLLDNNINRK
jgi:hypothetical protein